ncbi:hypothetical protein BDP27DRAFT_1359714 [Rhodocollybia butyracea]|uniref:Uncharacterized protein n=1 Tax=Rhodocollybia butyracea TaxID=206335 RepID=A0A9P5UCJ0_9AGAR|nr:hypothetical protein BDP27DRAFT_1359714 [Rhodocollybia butyracea]
MQAHAGPSNEPRALGKPTPPSVAPVLQLVKSLHTGSQAQDRFGGKPAFKPSRNAIITGGLQTEWENHLVVFKKNFMVPVVTFAPIHIPPQSNPPSSGLPRQPEDLTKAFNGALDRDSDDPVIYKGQYIKEPKPGNLNSYWVYFIRGDKRCRAKTPCFGCMVIHWTGSVLFERIGLYPEANNLPAGLTVEFMEKELENLLFKLPALVIEDTIASEMFPPSWDCETLFYVILRAMCKRKTSTIGIAESIAV